MYFERNLFILVVYILQQYFLYCFPQFYWIFFFIFCSEFLSLDHLKQPMHLFIKDLIFKLPSFSIGLAMFHIFQIFVLTF